MTRRLKGRSLLTALFIAISIPGCSTLGIGCEQAAERDIADLKKIIIKQLPESIAATQSEGNGCDSGDGGYLWFTADIAADSTKIIEKFLESGWERVDPKKHGVGARFVDGVTTRWNGREVNLILGEDDDDSKMSILAEFR